jgi:hypothetical protein
VRVDDAGTSRDSGRCEAKDNRENRDGKLDEICDSRHLVVLITTAVPPLLN